MSLLMSRRSNYTIPAAGSLTRNVRGKTDPDLCVVRERAAEAPDSSLYQSYRIDCTRSSLRYGRFERECGRQSGRLEIPSYSYHSFLD